ncbi:hypothetical protein AVEN_39710-1 [Araneus ventricosus]|uniref:Transposase Tc1-like domain-containing protein n=1 Tax=Araneus ventricosus TaxID=182803 RepID=A0A4Y2LWP1_ARAVE|nr:hypothetical protein AVEN_39710-1 [Araneus ventricosus]
MTVTPAVDGKVLVIHASSKKKDVGGCPASYSKIGARLTQLTAQCNAGLSASVSEHTVQRTLLDMELCSRRPTRVPLLTKRHRQLRLQWAREHRDWTMDEWKGVAWSDEF